MMLKSFDSQDGQEIQASALVQGLIRRDGHPNLIAHAQQQQAALGAIDGHLAEDQRGKP